jgi:hypothetical protein
LFFERNIIFQSQKKGTYRFVSGIHRRSFSSIGCLLGENGALLWVFLTPCTPYKHSKDIPNSFESVTAFHLLVLKLSKFSDQPFSRSVGEKRGSALNPTGIVRKAFNRGLSESGLDERYLSDKSDGKSNLLTYSAGPFDFS